MAKPCMMLLLVYSAAALKVSQDSQETPQSVKYEQSTPKVKNNYGINVPQSGDFPAVAPPHEVVASLIPGVPTLAAAFNPANWGTWATTILHGESAQVDTPKLKDPEPGQKPNPKQAKRWAIGDKDWIQPEVQPELEDAGIQRVTQRSRFGDAFASVVEQLHPEDSQHIPVGYGENKHFGSPGAGHGNLPGFTPSVEMDPFKVGTSRQKEHHYLPLNPPENMGYENANVMENGRRMVEEARAAKEVERADALAKAKAEQEQLVREAAAAAERHAKALAAKN